MRRERSAFAGFFRAFATFAIVAYHVWLLDINLKPAEATHIVSLAMWGQFAVACFFTLSGFLLGRPFLRAIAEGRALPSWRRFARDRFLRIYPLYAVATLLCAALAPLVQQAQHPPTAADIVAHLALVQSWFRATALGIAPPYWTMSTDAGFYIVLPFVAYGLLRLGGATRGARLRNVAIGLTALVALALALRIARTGDARLAVGDFAFDVVAFGNVPTMFVAFGGGMLAALVWIACDDALRRRLGALSACIAIVPLVAALDQLPRDPAATIVYNAPLAALAASLLLFAGLATPQRWWDRPAIRWAERLSYAVYLFHFGVLKTIDRVALPLSAGWYFVVTLALGYAVALLVALPAYLFIERPFLRWKQRLRDTRPDEIAFVRTSAP